MIVPIRLSISNAFLVRGERPVLIDTGCPGDTDTLLRALAKEGIAARDLSLMPHTHGHRDHAGGTRRLKGMTAAPVAVHPTDAVEPELALDEGMDLRPYGVAGKVVATPGHTTGSVSVLLDSGEAVAGDLLVGGYLGGLLSPHAAGYPYFVEDMAALRDSVRKLLSYSPSRVYVGHGGPLSPSDIAKRFAAEVRP
jgi:glyoxylase-like metal-dependent hydrolase (beta-lactamase superfamily II)